jgi:hypothetical protein
MRRATICGTLVGLALALAAAPGWADDVSAEQVRTAIEQGVAYLKSQQRGDGSWSEWVNQPGGVTSLSTLAMLNSGVPVEDDGIQRALTYLRKLRADQINATYSVALQTMVFCRAEPKRDLGAISRNVDWLTRIQIQEGPTRGSWAYPGAYGEIGDNSNSQFALLALHEAERVGVTVEPRVWRLAKAYWEGCQNPDGSWGYKKNLITGVGSEPIRGSMTCAGISSLVICADMVHQSDATADGDRIQCCQRAESDNERLERALQWLGTNFAVTRNPGATQQSWLLYYLYGLERVGRLTAQRFIGGHDWYREGAAHLLNMKGGVAVASGWRGVGAEERDDRVATSFALLFLSKGRRPVLLAKLKHSGEDEWNQHRSDAANLTRYVETRWNRDLTWQAVDLDAATIDDLGQSPVLYYCGRTSPLPRSPEAVQKLAQKLRGYIDRGGFLFAEAYSTGAEFDTGFRELMTRVFPEPEYRLQLLPPEHPIWRAEERVDPALMRPMWGIEFGCRTSVVYCPPDDSGRLRPSLSCLWELSRHARGQQYTPKVQAEVDAGLAIGINVLAYATNRELKTKDMIPSTTAEPAAGDSFRRGRLRIANLRHPGGCNAAPRALTTLLETAAAQLKIRVEPPGEPIGITDPALFDYHMVFMHGRNAFSLTPQERQQLKTYVERGGMLFANSICASRAFTESFRREMQTIFPNDPLKPIPADDPLFTTEHGGYDLSTVTRRDPQSSGEGPLRGLLRKVSPELEGIRIGDRYAVVFSRYDLSCALEKHDSLECQGYTREDAARIALNVLLYSLQQ